MSTVTNFAKGSSLDSNRGSAAQKPKKTQSAGPKKSVLLTVVGVCILLYFLFPIAWLLIASTKSTTDLFTSFGLWFSDSNNIWANIKATVTHEGGIFGRWMANTILYATVSAIAATFLCALGGYGFSKFHFRGSEGMFMTVVGAIMVPTTALAIPTYLLFSQVNLVDTPLAIILPSMVSPFGLYLMRIYADSSVPDSVIEAARIDGATEFRIFSTIALRLLTPGLVTVILFTLVATWNNYFLPLIMLNSSKYYPITVGLAAWSSQTAGGAGSDGSLISLVITGSLLSIIPLVVAFVFLQKYWQSGLAAGSVKQ